jgi:hypothetical protein
MARGSGRLLRFPGVTRRLLFLLAQLLAMALADEAPARAARAIGTKPFSTKELVALVKQLLGAGVSSA